MIKRLLIAAFVFVLFSLPAAAQSKVEIRFMCYQDGTECDAYTDLLNQFMADNPDISVVTDVVPYATVRDNLRVQVEAGEAPDMARITDFAGMAGHYLDLRPLLSDPALMEDNFSPAVLAAFRNGADDNGLYGFPDAATVTGPYINRTLFDQAGVDVLGEGATWEEWIAALTKVRDATGVQYAFAIDNKGHRFAGPAMSLGAHYFDADGNFNLAHDAGFASFATMLKSWLDSGLSPRETWASGDTYQAANTYFINAQTVMYFSGSWQIGGFANSIGGAFDWQVVPNPTGPGGSTGVAGGAGIVGYSQTAHPEAVAKVMEYLLQPATYAEFSGRTLNIPADTAVINMGVDYQTDSQLVKDALAVFSLEIPKLQDQAIQLNLNPLAFAYYDASNTRLAQYFAGELTLDEAMQKMQDDIDAAKANAASGS